MFLKRLRLHNFGAFRDTGWLTFTGGVNLIVGQNNSGKSSFIKSLSLTLPDTPHISLDSYLAEELQRPRQELELLVTGREMRQALLKHGGSFYWPLGGELNDLSQEAIDHDILGETPYTMKFERVAGAMKRIEGQPTHSIFEGNPTHFVHLSAERPNVRLAEHAAGYQDTVVDMLQRLWTEVFIFDSERIGVGQCGQDDVERLGSRAENLPAFLHIMRGRRPAVFDRLVDQVRSILPTVYSITTTSVGSNQTRILVWPTEHMDREEFSFPLSESGTGVGQVVAILAAAISSNPTIFIIDEINSYLHPTAVKALLRVLQSDYRHHQYLISTHAPEVIANGGANSVHLVKRDGMDSIIQSVDMNDIDDLRDMAGHIGISISDVFAADHVIWVEGRTEELCFSLLRDKTDVCFPPNTIISSVVATGDFFSAKRDIDLVFRIYDKLARVSLPLVRSVAFSFDREGLTAAEMDDTNRRARGQVAFLPRRHLECYLINSRAISMLANEADLERSGEYTAEVIEDLLTRKAGDPRYLANGHWNGDSNDSGWLSEVDAANLISDVLAELTEQRVNFDKVEHSPWLLSKIIEIDRGSIEGLVTHLRRLAELLAPAATPRD